MKHCFQTLPLSLGLGERSKVKSLIAMGSKTIVELDVKAIDRVARREKKM
jgi:hypothetical protein